MKSIEVIAKVCHEANRAYCQTLGDDSQPAWEDAPEWQRDSAISEVMFALQNQDASLPRLHNDWFREKQAAGWKYGPVKDPEKKEHPCMVPYDELPVEQRAKDALFIGIVSALRWIVDEKQADRQGWRSMETAPTDGTYVLLWDGKREVTGHYDSESPWDHGWVVWYHESDCEPIDPIAWMPLPPPPEDKGDGEALSQPARSPCCGATVVAKSEEGSPRYECECCGEPCDCLCDQDNQQPATMNAHDAQRKVIEDVLAERRGQDEEWGTSGHSPLEWLAILGEEFGELSEAVLSHHLGAWDILSARREAIQMAAVAIAMVEDIDRRMQKKDTPQ